MSGYMRKLVDELWYCLPADGADDIAAKLSARLGRKFYTAQVHYAISWVRGHVPELEWTIPPARRGPNFRGRYFRMLTDGSGVKVMDNEGIRSNFEAGFAGTVSATAKVNRHQAEALWAASKLTSSSKYRTWMEGLAEDTEALSKKAARVAKILKFGT